MTAGVAKRSSAESCCERVFFGVRPVSTPAPSKANCVPVMYFLMRIHSRLSYLLISKGVGVNSAICNRCTQSVTPSNGTQPPAKKWA
jgi:hypothetical protein